MTVARRNQIDLQATSYYHCITRCVRRSYLCGHDNETGQDYSHRKDWLISQMKRLANIFAIKICAYAVMSNHYHLVLFVDTKSADEWDEIEIRNRWGKLFYKDAKRWDMLPDDSAEKHQKTVLWNDRLMDISWFMRCLNEMIARLSNKEDKCKGRFWEGRFKCQALLDEAAVLSAMAYVDLNPIRAGIASTPEHSEHTSVKERIDYANKQRHKLLSKFSSDKDIEIFYNSSKQPPRLMPFKNNKQTQDATIDCTLSEYLLLVDEVGRSVRSGKRGAISGTLLPILERLNLKFSHWIDFILGLEEKFSYAIGHAKRLSLFMKSAKLRSPKGTPLALQCYQMADVTELEKHLDSHGNMKIDGVSFER